MAFPTPDFFEMLAGVVGAVLGFLARHFAGKRGAP